MAIFPWDINPFLNLPQEKCSNHTPLPEGHNGSKLRGTTELELQIANECCRLIANIIIYYNTFILSRIYEEHEKSGDTAVLEFLKKRSPVAWRHLNMNGRYEFSTAEEINIEVMIANLVFRNTEKFEGGG